MSKIINKIVGLFSRNREYVLISVLYVGCFLFCISNMWVFTIHKENGCRVLWCGSDEIVGSGVESVEYVFEGADRGRAGIGLLSLESTSGALLEEGSVIDLYSYSVISIGGRIGIDSTVFAPKYAVLLRWSWYIAIQEVLLFILFSLEWRKYLGIDRKVSIELIDNGFAILMFLGLYNILCLVSFLVFIL